MYLLFSFPSRLCAAGVPRCPEADPHGGDEVPGDTAGRHLRSSGDGPAQDGDPHGGGSTSGSATTQAQTPRHERPDALRLLRRRDVEAARTLKVP